MEENRATTYYYAYINGQNIVEQILAMPSPISLPNYIAIASNDQSLIGKRYSKETGEFEAVSWYCYIILNGKNIVTEVLRLETQVPEPVPDYMVAVSTYDESLMGTWYNRKTGTFSEAPIHVLADMSTDKINVGVQDLWLSDKLSQTDTALQAMEDIREATALAVERAVEAKRIAEEALEAIAKQAHTIDAIPTQTGSLIYTGSQLSPTWNSYNPGMTTLGGVTSGTNAGVYTATFTPKEGYSWSGGSIDSKSVTWSIAKVAGSLALSKKSVSLDLNSATNTVIVSRSGDGLINALSSNTSIATVSVSGTTMTVTAKGIGSATITVSVAEGTNHTAPVDQTVTVTSNIPSSTLADNSWEQIAAEAAAGNAGRYWKIGDEKTIRLIGGEILTLQIYGFNHDDLAFGGRAAITFGLKNVMAAMRQMHTSNTVSGGFVNTSLYSWLQGDLYDSLPADLKPHIKTVNKKTAADGVDTTISSNAKKIFLFSEVECFGSTKFSAVGEGSLYPIFTGDKSRIKYLPGSEKDAANWLLRSINRQYSSSYCNVHYKGAFSGGDATSIGGVCFGFCI